MIKDKDRAEQAIAEWQSWRRWVNETWPDSRWKRWRWYVCLFLPKRVSTRWAWRR